MNAKVKLSKKTAKQVSRTSGMLMWLQDNPKRMRNTNCAQIARDMGNTFGNFAVTQHHLVHMVQNQILHRNGTKKRSDFSINYLHKDVLPFVRERASKEDKKIIRDALAMAKAKDCTLSSDGCVTKTLPKKPKTIKVKGKSVATPVPVTRVNNPIKVRRTPNGVSVSINLTINLNQ